MKLPPTLPWFDSMQPAATAHSNLEDVKLPINPAMVSIIKLQSSHKMSSYAGRSQSKWSIKSKLNPFLLSDIRLEQAKRVDVVPNNLFVSAC